MGYRPNFFEKSFLRNTLLQVLSTYTAAITLSVANTCTVASTYVVASTYNVASTYEVAPRTFIPLQELALLGYCKYFRCCKYIGKTSKRKNFSIWALPELPKPHPPIRATLPTFSGRQKRRFARMVEKNTDDHNNCCHDNFYQNFGNFGDNDDKKY